MKTFIALFFSIFFLLVSSNPKKSDPNPLSQDPFTHGDILPMFTIFQIMDDISNEIFRSFEGSGPGFLSHNHSPKKQKSKNVKNTIFTNGDTVVHKVIIKTYDDGEETEETIESSQNTSDADYEKANVTFIENNDNNETTKNVEKNKNNNQLRENEPKKEQINIIDAHEEEKSKTNDELEEKLKFSRKMKDNSRSNGVSLGMIVFYLIVMLTAIFLLVLIAIKTNTIKIAINFKKLGFLKSVQKEEFVQIKDDLLSINKTN